MMRAAAWGQLLFIVCCVGYSTYALFQGNFEQAILPYPVLILYYLVFLRRKMKATPSTEKDEPGK